MMKQLTYLFLIALVFAACESHLEETKRESVYLMHRAGFEPVRGKVIFTELAPAKIKVEIRLDNTVGKYDFPAHLHFGSIDEVGELAYRLNDVDGNTGSSVTILDHATFENDILFTFEMLNEMNGSVKVHLSDDLFKHVVLSYGNIGANRNYIKDGVAICTGH